MDSHELRAIAVDWSGRKTRAAKHIWLAEANHGHLLRLESGRSREEVIDHLVGIGVAYPHLVVGLDFAFGMPEWFANHLGTRSAEEFWSHVAAECEAWLARCDWPLWGRPRKPRHDDYEPLRQTEKDVRARFGDRAFSTFQIGGAGAVGTGSLRGMPFLLELASAGWSNWPFGAVAFPLAIEIYPRVLTGAVRKSCKECRELYLAERYPDLPPEMFDLAASTEDAFDAAVSAMVMAEHERAFYELSQAANATEAIEGRIWQAPGDVWVASQTCPIH